MFTSYNHTYTSKSKITVEPTALSACRSKLMSYKHEIDCLPTMMGVYG